MIISYIWIVNYCEIQNRRNSNGEIEKSSEGTTS